MKLFANSRLATNNLVTRIYFLAQNDVYNANYRGICELQ